MATATLTTATVKYAAGPPRENKYGRMRINAVLTLPDGTEDRVWGDPSDTAITALRKGDTVQVFRDSKGLKLIEAESTAPAPQSTGHQPPADSEAAFDEAIRRSAKRYDKCVALAKASCLKNFGLTEEALRGDLEMRGAAIVKEIAAALFIEGHKLTR